MSKENPELPRQSTQYVGAIYPPNAEPSAPMQVAPNVPQSPLVTQHMTIFVVDTSIVPVGHSTAIVCSHNKLQLRATNVANNQPVYVWSSEKNDQQRWIFTFDGYVECAADRNLVLDCSNGEPGTPIMLRHKRLSPSMDPYDPYVISQKFRVVKNGKHVVIVPAVNEKCVLDLSGAIHDFGKGDVVRLCPIPKANPVLATSIEDAENFTPQQRWRFSGKKYVPSYAPLRTPVLIKHKSAKQYITTNGQVSEGSAPVMFKLGFKNRDWRRFIIDEHGFISPIGNMNCVLACAGDEAGSNIVLQKRSETNALHQRWLIGLCHLKKYRVITSALNPELVLDAKDGALVLNTNNKSLDKSQKWSIKIK
jgi:hypothetical protein